MTLNSVIDLSKNYDIYVMNINFIVMVVTVIIITVALYLCSYPGLKGPGNKASTTISDSLIYR